MRDFNFQYDADFPPEIRKTIEPILNEAAWLFPLWMQKAIITWDSKQEDAMAKIEVYKDYRWCRIIICPDLLSISPEVQKESLLHEIIHCYNVPLKKIACDILDDLLDDENDAENKLHDVYLRQIDKTMEEITQDLTFQLANKFNER